jgi:hypothetical protein
VFRFDQDKARRVFNTIVGNKESIVITLVLTKKCCFECESCFYGLGPRKNPKYMSHRMLRKIENICNTLSVDYGIGVTVNLLGGEPTVNLNEFDRVCEWAGELQDQGHNIEMTTNGWWLERPKATYRVLKSLQRIDYDLDGRREFCVRISNDRYHDQFHKKNMSFNHILNELKDFGIHPYGEMYDNEYDYIDLSKLKDMIFVDQRVEDDNIIPSGIRGQFGYNDIGVEGRCRFTHSLCYDPDGKLFDGCGSGSYMPFGTVDDDPFVLMCMEKYYIDTVIRPECVSCRDCRDTSKRFRRSSAFRKAKAYFNDKAHEYLCENDKVEDSELCEITS